MDTNRYNRLLHRVVRGGECGKKLYESHYFNKIDYKIKNEI